MDIEEEHEIIQLQNQNLSSAGSATEGPLPKLIKADLERMFGDNNRNLSFQNASGRSGVWKTFQNVHFEGKSVPFVKCTICNRFYGWHSKDGTSTLSVHASKCGGSTKPSNSTPQQSSLKLFAKKPSQKAIEDLNTKIMIGLAEDIRPLSSIEGNGFKRIAQHLINFGAKHGSVKTEDILQSRVTLKKYLHNTATTEKEKLATQIKTEALLTGSYFAITFDMWADDFKQRPFLSATLHYIDDQFTMRTPLLGVEQFEVKSQGAPEKSTENIRSFLHNMLIQYFSADQLQLILINMTAVTDSGSNMKKVFSKRYSCKCHDLNLALEWTFEKESEKENATIKFEKKKADIESRLRELEDLPSKTMERSKLMENLTSLSLAPKKTFILSKACPGVKATIVAVKSLVSYFKQSGLNKELRHSLKQDVPSRWNSHLILLESYQKSREDVRKILCAKNKLDKLHNINDEVVDQLVELLKIFRECSESLSADKKPTIHLVAQWKEILTKHLQEKQTDLPEIQGIKLQLVVCFDEYFKLMDLHLAAAMLDPRCKSLRFLSLEDREAAKSFLRVLFEKIKCEDSSGRTATTEDTEPRAGDSIQPAKKSRFADLQDGGDEIDPNSFESELQRYFNAPVISDEEGFDILGFWRDLTHCRILRKLALRILGIPASQASDERIFSTTGQTLSSRRAALSGSTVSDLTFIKKNVCK